MKFCKLHFLFADTHVLPDTILGCRDLKPLSPGFHPALYCMNVGVDHSRRRHTSCRVDCVIVILEKFRQNIYIAVEILVLKLLKCLSLIVLWARSKTAHFTSGFLQLWNWMPSSRSMSWKCLCRNSMTLSVRTHTGLRESSSWNRDQNAEVIDARSLSLRAPDAGISRKHRLQIECSCTYYNFCEGMHIQKITLPIIHEVGHCVGITQEPLPYRLMQCIGFLLF